VPGAATNQPPLAATAPINGASQPLQAAGAGSSGGGLKREAVTNYEVDKTVRVTRNATGSVKRLNAAVVLNHRTATDAKGKTTTTPLPPEEVEKLTALVQEAIGFNKERGDSVKLISAPFKAPVEPAAENLPLWKQVWLLDLLRASAVPAGLTLVALALIFGVIRPSLRPPEPIVLEPAEEAEAALGQQLDAVVDDDNALPGTEGGLPALEAPKENTHLEAARKLARENPAAVAMIMRDWVTGVASAG
jgi:flagellar M-ring protein FliF